MRKRTYRNYEYRKHNDCNIKINDYRTGYVINQKAKEYGISKSKLIEIIIETCFPKDYYNVPDCIDNIISCMKSNIEYGIVEDENAFKYYIKRLEDLKKTDREGLND